MMPTTSTEGSLRGLAILASEQRKTFRSTDGVTYLWTPAPGLLVSRVEGCLTVSAARGIGGEFKQQVRTEGKHLAFHDWEEMTNYDDGARAHLTEVSRQMLPHIEVAHILLRSSLVAFGVRTAAIVVRSIRVHTDRAPFEAALRAALVARRAHGGRR